MNDIFELEKKYEEQAWQVIRETGIIEIWESVGCTVNLVGSLRTGLIMKNVDIDFHIYSDPFSLSNSFKAISLFAEQKGVKEIYYSNLLDAEDMCIEWHAIYENKEGVRWKIDMIHILKESPYAGVFEETAERIKAALTDETRRAILEIKNDTSAEEKVMGILIYKAVIKDGIRDYPSFRVWLQANKCEGIELWRP